MVCAVNDIKHGSQYSARDTLLLRQLFNDRKLNKPRYPSALHSPNIQMGHPSALRRMFPQQKQILNLLWLKMHATCKRCLQASFIKPHCDLRDNVELGNENYARCNVRLKLLSHLMKTKNMANNHHKPQILKFICFIYGEE